MEIAYFACVFVCMYASYIGVRGGVICRAMWVLAQRRIEDLERVGDGRLCCILQCPVAIFAHASSVAGYCRR